MRPARAGLTLLLAGALQALSLAWPGPGPQGEPLAALQLLAGVLMVAVLLRAPNARAAFAVGWCFALAWLAGTFWWLFISLHVYGGLAAPLALLAVLALAAALALYYGLATCWAWRARAQVPWRLALVLAGTMTLAELARGQWLTGFPWGATGYSHLLSLAPLAPWVGVYGLGALAWALAAYAVAAWMAGRRAQAAVGLGMVLGCALLPYADLRTATFTRSSGDMEVALLQGNIPQDEKFEGDRGVPLALAWYREQLAQELRAAGVRTTLVVAPETAIPLLPQDIEPRYWRELLKPLADSRSAFMLGIPLGHLQAGYTNSVRAWTPGTAQALLDALGPDDTRPDAYATLVKPPPSYRYDKHHLVPFGEFIPVGFRWFTELLRMPLGDFNRGAPTQGAFDWAGQRVSPHVCYEDLFGEELAALFADPAHAPTVLVNVSNIAWFGDTTAVAQHRNISRMRAMELQRPVLRATNTGATVVIDHRGQVRDALPAFTRGVLRARVEGRAGHTPYAGWAGRWGLFPLWAGALLLAVWGGRSPWRGAARRP